MHASMCAMWANRSDALTTERVLGELFDTEEKYIYTLRGLKGTFTNFLRDKETKWNVPEPDKMCLPKHECEVFYANLHELYAAHSLQKFEELRMQHLSQNSENESSLGGKGRVLSWTNALETFFQNICASIPTLYVKHLNRQDLVMKSLGKATKTGGKNPPPNAKELKAALDIALADEDFGGNSLQGILMSPMQRTITYMLLLERLMKTTNDEASPHNALSTHSFSPFVM